MKRNRTRKRLALVVAVLGVIPWAGDVGQAQTATQKASQTTVTDVAGRKHVIPKRVTQAERQAAADRLKAKVAAAKASAVKGAEAQADGALPAGAAAPSPQLGQYLVGPNKQLIPDYSGLTANWAYSPIVDKFVDPLPDLKGLIAKPDVVSYPGSDYYEIELFETTWQFHSQFPNPTTVRIYRQTNKGTDTLSCVAPPEIATPPARACDPTDNTLAPPAPGYLGPVIVASRGRPVRVRFTNSLPTGAGGNLQIPVDATVMGSGPGPAATWDNGNKVWLPPADQQCAPNASGIVPVACFTQNRATIHLHGGVTPWISDGTTHQWITPAGEATPYKNGASVYNVPDMPGAGKPGADGPGGVQTFYWTNDQAARLMFYHDHAHGITRLNVYVGEAAGYLLRDDAERALETAGLIPPLGDNIPLVLQEKGFVDATTIGATDPTWNWGTGTVSDYTDPNGVTIGWRAPVTGDLWWPHVYMPAQNPSDLSGYNAMGRWNYGPWFFPPTPIPYMPVLNPYYDPINAPWQPYEVPGTPNPSWGAEAFLDTPVINGKAYPTLTVEAKPVRFRILNAGGDRFFNLQLYRAFDNTTDTTADRAFPLLAAPVQCDTPLSRCTEVKMVQAAPGTGLPANWPQDGRAGGVPDPTTAGPSWIVIGTEGGFLPYPVVVAPQPVVWNNDPLTFNFGNVSDFSLLLGPAERADAIVDFTGLAGQTFIVYNDAPAAFPALDPRNDYYTGNPDQTDTGGTVPTMPGKGPNMRTIMQIHVVAPSGTPAPAPFDLAALQAAFTTTATQDGVFKASQDPIIVGQSDKVIGAPGYEVAYGKTFPSTYPYWGLGSIFNSNVKFETVDGQLVSLLAEPKAIHDEMGATFDDYGRMKASLGVQMPNPTPNLANFIMQGYAEPATELVKLVATPIGNPASDGTEIWRINHNGVDTHPIHFHLFHVQVVNRVGWDGAYRPPHPTELGWKDTVRVSPLEDTYVALRPIAPRPDSLPFKVPNSYRPFEPALPDTATIDGIDPTGAAYSVSNREANFGWEYVWHCHILSHEENDMMRAVIFAATPEAPTNLSATLTDLDTKATLTWVDQSLVTTGFTIQRDISPTFSAPTTTTVGLMTTYNDPGPLDPLLTYYYRVSAYNTVGSGVPNYPSITADSPWSNVASTRGLPPTVTFTGALASAAINSSFTVTATTNASTVPTITASGACTVGAVTSTPPSASALVTMTSGTGTCTLTATWAADGTYAAATATQSTAATLATPTVTFTGAPTSAPYNTSFTVTATTNASTQPTITANGACSIAGTLVTMTSGTGTCTLTATWAADANYAAATATQSTGATLATPTVTFTGALTSAPYNTSFPVTATTNASTVPTLTGTAGVCTVGAVTSTPPSASAPVTMTSGTGTCTLTATWAADANYAAATATQSTAATLATPTVTFTGAPDSAAYNTSFTVTATTNAGTQPTITANGACSIVGTLVTMTSGTGTCTLTATWGADANYAAATATQSTAATLATPTVGFTGAPASAVYGTSFTVTATTNAGVAPTIAGTAGVCTVGAVTSTPPSASAPVTMTSGTGTCTLTATWGADANYAAATATQSTAATLATPTVGFTGAPASAVYGTSFTVTATTNAGVAPTIAGTAGVCSVGSISGTATATATVSMISGTGTCTLTANWAATDNYAAASLGQSTPAQKAATTITSPSHSPNPSVVGQAVMVGFTIGPAVGPSGTVTVTASTGETCTASLPTTSCSLTFVTVGPRSISATYGGDANYSSSSSTDPTTQNVGDFAMGVSPGSRNVNGGQKASYTVTVTSLGGFNAPVALGCTVLGAPAGFSCTIAPTSVTPNGGSKSATVTVNTVKVGQTTTYTVEITGNYGSGLLIRKVSPSLTVKK